MTCKKILSALLLTTILSAPLLGESRDKPTQQELEAREKVIKDLVEESYGQGGVYSSRYSYYGGQKTVYRGRRDERGRIRLERSNEEQLGRMINFKDLPTNEQSKFMNTRNMAIAGLSAGGILYFLPGQNIFFWETKEDNLPEGSVTDGIITNPVIGGLLSSALSSAQQELKMNNNKFLGSSKLGHMLMMVLNPAEGLAQSINEVYGERVFSEGTTDITTISPMLPYSPAADSDRPTNYIGLHFQIRF